MPWRTESMGKWKPPWACDGSERTLMEPEERRQRPKMEAAMDLTAGKKAAQKKDG